MNGTAATTPAARASSTSSAASALLVASGFSQMTCLPALRAIRTNGACRWFGVQMCTTSTSGEVTSSSADAAPQAAPSWRAESSTSTGDASATAVRVPPAARTARAWTSPMKPSPMIPERSPVVALRRVPPNVMVAGFDSGMAHL